MKTGTPKRIKSYLKDSDNIYYLMYKVSIKVKLYLIGDNLGFHMQTNVAMEKSLIHRNSSKIIDNLWDTSI